MTKEKQVYFVHHSKDRNFVLRYREDLEQRQISVGLIDVDQLWEWRSEFQPGRQTRIVVVWTADLNGNFTAGVRLSRVLSTLDAANESHRAALLIPGYSAGAAPMPPEFHIYRQIDEKNETYDLAFEELLRFVFDPMPEYLDVWCRPSLMSRPSGAAWRTDDDIFVADERYGHLLKVRRRETNVLLVGLDHPNHLGLDRHK